MARDQSQVDHQSPVGAPRASRRIPRRVCRNPEHLVSKTRQVARIGGVYGQTLPACFQKSSEENHVIKDMCPTSNVVERLSL